MQAVVVRVGLEVASVRDGRILGGLQGVACEIEIHVEIRAGLGACSFGIVMRGWPRDADASGRTSLTADIASIAIDG